MKLELSKEIQQVLDLKKEYEAKIAAIGKEALASVLAPFFDQYPEVHSVRWSQYTLYFNDGDACTFGVNEAYIGVKAENIKVIQLDGSKCYKEPENDVAFFNEDNLHDWDRVTHKKSWKTPKLEELENNLNEVSNFLSEIEEILKSAFGDHVEVTIGRDGTSSVDSCDHD